MTRVKTRDLRGKKKEELLKALDEQKNELASLKVCAEPLRCVRPRSNAPLMYSGLEGNEWSGVEALEHPCRPKERRPHPHCDQPVTEAEP